MTPEIADLNVTTQLEEERRILLPAGSSEEGEKCFRVRYSQRVRIQLNYRLKKQRTEGP
jgi:hypothetical protein